MGIAGSAWHFLLSYTMVIACFSLALSVLWIFNYTNAFLRRFLDPCLTIGMDRVVLLTLQLLTSARVPVFVGSAIWAGGVSSVRLYQADRQGFSSLRADNCCFNVHELLLGLGGMLEEGSE